MTSPMKINGLDVVTNFGFVLGQAPGWADAPPRQVSVANLAGRGVRPSTNPVDMPRRVTLNGIVRGTSASDARSKLDKMKLELTSNPVKLSFSDQPTRYVNALLDSFTVPPDQMGSAVTKNLAVQIVLTAHDPLFYDDDSTKITLLLGGPMPMGTGIVRPLITLVCVVSAPPFFLDLKNSSGAVVATMTINQSSITTGTFIIDCENQILTRDGTNFLDKLSGDFFKIDPRIHANFSTSAWPEIVTRNIDSGSSPKVEYRRSWR